MSFCKFKHEIMLGICYETMHKSYMCKCVCDVIRCRNNKNKSWVENWGQNHSCGDKTTVVGTKPQLWGQNHSCGDKTTVGGTKPQLGGQNQNYGDIATVVWTFPHNKTNKGIFCIKPEDFVHQVSCSSNLTCKGHTTAGGGLVELKS